MIGAANLHDCRRHDYGEMLLEFVELEGWVFTPDVTLL